MSSTWSFARAICLALGGVLSGSVAHAQPAPPAQPYPPYPFPPQAYPYPPQGYPPAAPQPYAPQVPQRQTSSTKIFGQELVDADGDTDISVGRARITSADPRQRDVVESRPEERREVYGERITIAPLASVATNDLGFGLGARAGYTFELPFYLGGTFVYHFGSSTDETGPVPLQARSRFFYPAAEAGYDFGVGALLLRPYGGAGLLVGRTTTDTAGVEDVDTDTTLMVYPGVAVHYMLPKSAFFVGGDTRVLIPLETRSASFSVALTAGIGL